MTPERWLQLMNSWGFAENRATFDKLAAAYSERGRHYHTQAHVSACLKHLDSCELQPISRREIEMALWFHDAVYKTFSSNNEKDSADWAVKFLEQCGTYGEQNRRVHELIMVTEHDAPTKTPDEAILVDIDLSILGAAPSVYDLFEGAVRKEYKRVPFFIYRKKRAEILRGFIERPKIYTSGIFADVIERQARENMKNAISKLQLRDLVWF